MSGQPPSGGVATGPTVTAKDVLAGIGEQAVKPPGGVPTGPTVTAKDILAGIGEQAVKPLTGLQKAGLGILFFLFLFSIAALAPLVSVWYTHVPEKPVIQIDTKNNPNVITDTVKVLDFYKTASDTAAEQPLKWFDVLFTKILYPLVTLVLGYVFGATQQASASGTTT